MVATFTIRFGDGPETLVKGGRGGSGRANSDDDDSGAEVGGGSGSGGGRGGGGGGGSGDGGCNSLFFRTLEAWCSMEGVLCTFGDQGCCVRPELWQHAEAGAEQADAEGTGGAGGGLLFREWPLFEDVQFFIDARRLSRLSRASRQQGRWSWRGGAGRCCGGGVKGGVGGGERGDGESAEGGKGGDFSRDFSDRGGGGGGGIWRADALIYASTRRFDDGRLWYCLRCLGLVLLFLVGVAPSTLAFLYGRRRARGPRCCWTSEAPTKPPGAESLNGGPLLPR